QIGRNREDNAAVVAEMPRTVREVGKLPPAAAVPVFPRERRIALDLEITPDRGFGRGWHDLKRQIAGHGRSERPVRRKDGPLPRRVERNELHSRSESCGGI